MTSTAVPVRAIGLAVMVVACALDQAHKYWMLEIFDIGAKQPIALTPFMDVVLSWNYGISYSLFAARDGAARLVMLGAQAMIVAGLLYWLLRARALPLAVALGAVIGGALGNGVDRLLRGAVADFFYLHTSLPVGPLANYVFNVADVFITAGVALLIYESLFSEENTPA